MGKWKFIDLWMEKSLLALFSITRGILNAEDFGGISEDCGFAC
jgi:hypothetical protein